MFDLAIAGLLSSMIGIVLGLLGGGGGIIAVPVLVYAMGVGTKSAIATSLFFVAVTSAMGAGLAAREGRVRWRTGGLFGAGSVSGAFIGGKLAQLVLEDVLLGGLASLMLVTALAMLRGRPRQSNGETSVHVLRLVAIGGTVGLVSGLVGAGGGFLIVPALTLFGGLAIREAIGTSLFIISIQSFSGFAGHFGHVELSTPLLAVMATAAIAGMVVGRYLGGRVSAEGLRRGFAWLVLATGVFMLGRQIPLVWTGVTAMVALAVAVLFSRRNDASPAVITIETKCTTSLPTPP